MGVVLLVGQYVFLGLLFVFLVLLYRVMVADAMRGVGGARARERRAGRRVSRERRAEPVAARPEPPPAAPVRPAPAPSLPLEPIVAAPPEAQPEPEPAPSPSVAEAAREPCLVVVRSPDEERLAEGAVFKVSAATTMGRGQENTIVVPDRFASLHHALIYVADSRRVLRDRGSTNGTLLNGSRIRSEMPLSDGDRIEIGTTVLEYHQ